jgi:hypothetical protein
MKYAILFWHGYNENLAIHLLDFCNKEDGTIFFTGSLDEFAKKHDAIFMVRPEHSQICVTQFNSFSQR